MVWPDTLAWNTKENLWVSSNNLHKNIDGKMNFKDPKQPNFIIWKIKADQKSYTEK